MTHIDVKHALQGYHRQIKDDVKEHIHYSELIRRMAPTWLKQLMDEREYIASQFRRIEGCVVPGLANAIASETLRQMGEDTYVEAHSTAT